MPTYCSCGERLIDAGLDWVCPRAFGCPDIGFIFVPIRPSWDEYGLALAKTVSLRADCRRAQHGAVILGIDHRVVGTGYNGAPAGMKGCLAGACPRGLVPPSQLPHRAPYDSGIGLCHAIHAEANCLLYSSWNTVQGGTMYITGIPCHGCLNLIKGSGLLRAVWPGGEWIRAANGS